MTDLVINQPRAGYFKMRLVKGGPFVPVSIELYSAEFSALVAIVGDRERDVPETWNRCCGRPIGKSEYDYMMAVREWARANDRTAPEANPTTPIDIRTLKPTL